MTTDAAQAAHGKLLALVTATAFEMRAALAGLAQGGDPLLCAGAGATPGAELVVPERGAALAQVAGQRMLLLVTGVGPVNAALEMGAALGRYGISGVLNLGVAGSFDLEQAPLASTAAACREIYPEFGVTGLPEMAGQTELADVAGFPFPQWEDASGKVLQAMELAPDEAAKAMGLSLHDGVRRASALTVAGVTGSFERARAIAARHGALIESMEGFPLALACRTRNVHFLEVRTISNRVGERDRANWKLKQALEGLGDALAGLFPAQISQTNRVHPTRSYHDA